VMWQARTGRQWTTLIHSSAPEQTWGNPEYLVDIWLNRVADSLNRPQHMVWDIMNTCADNSNQFTTRFTG